MTQSEQQQETAGSNGSEAWNEMKRARIDIRIMVSFTLGGGRLIDRERGTALPCP